MKNFHLTVLGVMAIFLLLMGMVASVSFLRKSNNCKIDPAQIREIREMSCAEK